MIPPQALGKACILITGDEDSAHYSLGVVIAKEAYLRKAANWDKKLQLSSAGRENIFWIFRDAPYPKNFWLTIPKDVPIAISKMSSGNDKMTKLYELLPDVVIPRKIILDVAPPGDPMRRSRRDNRGTPNGLEEKGIVLLSGHKPAHRALAAKWNLGHIASGEYIAHPLRSIEELKDAVSRHD